MNEKIQNLIRTKICLEQMKMHGGVRTDPYLWIFSSTDNRHFNYNARYLFLYVKEHCPKIRPRFVINDDVLRASLNLQYGPAPGGPGGAENYFIETKSASGIRLVLSAGVWFTSAGLPAYGFHLNRGRRIVNLWHGVPLKTIALSDRSESAFSRLYFKKLFSENYTDVAATSPAVSRVMRKSLGVPEDRMRTWGQPRCDVLFEMRDRAAFFGRIYPDYGILKVSRTVLYAPTFRSGAPVRLFPFADFDRKKLEAYLEREKILLCIRMHLNEADDMPLEESRYVRFLNADRLEDIMEGLSAFDALVTDYSSIYIDYLLLDRPVIFLPYDLEDYRRTHGFSFPFEKVTPGPKPESTEAFLQAISQPSGADPYAKERRKIRRLFYEEAAPCSGRITADVSARLGISV